MHIIIQLITSVFLIIMCKKWFDPEMPTPSKILATVLGVFLSLLAIGVFFANGPLTNYLYTLTTAIQIVHPIVIFLLYGLEIALGIFTGIKCAKNACAFIPEEDHELRFNRGIKVAAVTATVTSTIIYVFQLFYAWLFALLLYLATHAR
jgi:hypothetical protein